MPPERPRQPLFMLVKLVIAPAWIVMAMALLASHSAVADSSMPNGTFPISKLQSGRGATGRAQTSSVKAWRAHHNLADFDQHIGPSNQL